MAKNAPLGAEEHSPVVCGRRRAGRSVDWHGGLFLSARDLDQVQLPVAAGDACSAGGDRRRAANLIGRDEPPAQAAVGEVEAGERGVLGTDKHPSIGVATDDRRSARDLAIGPILPEESPCRRVECPDQAIGIADDDPPRVSRGDRGGPGESG